MICNNHGMQRSRSSSMNFHKAFIFLPDNIRLYLNIVIKIIQNFEQKYSYGKSRNFAEIFFLRVTDAIKVSFSSIWNGLWPLRLSLPSLLLFLGYFLRRWRSQTRVGILSRIGIYWTVNPFFFAVKIMWCHQKFSSSFRDKSLKQKVKNASGFPFRRKKQSGIKSHQKTLIRLKEPSDSK